MNHRNIANGLALAGFVASLVAAGASAANQITFIGGGYAELCSALAHHVEDKTAVELTGSRMSVPPVQICTMAIEEEAGTQTERAGNYTNRGVLLFEEGRLEAALADFDRAIELAETLATAHINRGYTLVALQRWDESIPAFDRGIELGAPDPARAHFNRAIAHEELGNLRAAYYDYRTASELNPEWEEPRRELARFTVR